MHLNLLSFETVSETITINLYTEKIDNTRLQVVYKDECPNFGNITRRCLAIQIAIFKITNVQTFLLDNPIMVELKLLHNDEIQIKKQRKAYKNKFIQYINATNACLSVFWVFDVHKRGSDSTKFKDLEVAYKDLDIWYY